MDWDMSPKTAPSTGVSEPPPNTWLLGPTESNPKRYLDRFIRFCRGHVCVKQTDRPTNTQTHTDILTTEYR